MKILERIAHWLFALFMTALAAIIAGFGLTYISVKLVKPDPATPMTAIYIFAALYLTQAVAATVGIVSAPYSHRKAAAIVFPVLAFLGLNYKTLLDPSSKWTQLQFFIDVAVCALVGLLFFLRAKPKRPSGAAQTQEQP